MYQGRRVGPVDISYPFSSKILNRSYMEASLYSDSIVIKQSLRVSSHHGSAKLFRIMEDHGRKRKGKRILDDDDEEDNHLRLVPTEEETPSFVRVLLEALKMNGVRYVCPYLMHTQCTITREELHPGNWKLLLSKIFNGELLSTFGRSNPGTLAGGSSVGHPTMSQPPTMTGSGGQKLQLCVETKMPTYLFAGDNIKGEGGSDICVCLIDLNNGSVVQTGPVSAAEVKVVVLHGHFNEEIKYGREHNFFKSHEVKEREGKRPLLAGTLRVKLQDGIAILGGLSFTDNSSFTRSRQFRLGVEMDSGFYKGVRVMEAKTNAFRVKDQRGKANEKHDTPALHDEVWRLENIAKGGTIHKSLIEAKIETVEDLLHLHVKDPQSLRKIVKRMKNKMWEATIKHAMNSGNTSSSAIVTNTQVAPLQCLDQTRKNFHSWKAHKNWNQAEECDDQFFSSLIIPKEVHDGPTEHASITPTQTGLTLASQTQPNYTSAPQQLLEPSLSSSDLENRSLQNDLTRSEDHDFESWINDMQEIDNFNMDDGMRLGMASGDPLSDSSELYWELLFGGEPQPAHKTAKGVVGWLKVKAVLKWGIMVRNSAAKKRAKLTELDCTKMGTFEQSIERAHAYRV